MGRVVALHVGERDASFVHPARLEAQLLEVVDLGVAQLVEEPEAQREETDDAATQSQADDEVAQGQEADETAAQRQEAEEETAQRQDDRDPVQSRDEDSTQPTGVDEAVRDNGVDSVRLP